MAKLEKANRFALHILVLGNVNGDGGVGFSDYINTEFLLKGSWGSHGYALFGRQLQ